jgi:hypothetical protein
MVEDGCGLTMYWLVECEALRVGRRCNEDGKPNVRHGALLSTALHFILWYRQT